MTIDSTDTKLTVSLRSSSDPAVEDLTFTNALTVDQWNNIAVTYSFLTAQVRCTLYITFLLAFDVKCEMFNDVVVIIMSAVMH